MSPSRCNRLATCRLDVSDAATHGLYAFLYALALANSVMRIVELSYKLIVTYCTTVSVRYQSAHLVDWMFTLKEAALDRLNSCSPGWGVLKLNFHLHQKCPI